MSKDRNTQTWVPKTPFLRAGVVLSIQLFLCLAHLILLYQPASPKVKTSNEHLTKKNPKQLTWGT